MLFGSSIFVRLSHATDLALIFFKFVQFCHQLKWYNPLGSKHRAHHHNNGTLLKIV